ncbi:MAG: hypothetical protein COC19_03065 [SAR86 cluster bacterium]|uniref:GspL cytoplasmic actin-ATPase-like domain-containing protein n=1 Tax=SAR86 cluster bacterium TaxID=2030880 RepID=A0A2A4MQS3_9GAMM|nr:MAG: hypothetical protein COC19_03065 [SAR86 cluster bacterium]
MPSTITMNKQRLSSIFERLPTPVQTLFKGNPQQELLSQVICTLVVWNEQIIHLETGNSSVIQTESDVWDAKSLASACKKLIATTANITIKLLLPADHFVATSVNMPGVNKDNLISALKLQAETLLPSNEKPLAIAVNPASSQDSESVALWISEQELDLYFDAFKKEGMFIAAIMPRLMTIHSSESDYSLIDSDQQNCTLARFRHNVLVSWQNVNKLDFQQAEFEQQWQDLVTRQASITELNKLADYRKQAISNVAAEYCFFPQAALKANKKVEKGRKVLLAFACLIVILALAAVPFGKQSWQFRQLAKVLENNRSYSLDARQDQQVVVGFENEWGLINDFPDQQLREAMFTLAAVLSPEPLSSFEINEGLIQIQGSSTNPQAILQRLEQSPMFTEVVFARATNNSRYYIDLRLSTVNFEGYKVRYFPDN